MPETESILNPPSPEAVDQTAYAVEAICEAVGIIREHYADATCWPGWRDDAGVAVRLATQLLSMAAAEATLHAR